MRQLSILIIALWSILSASVIVSQIIGQVRNAPMITYSEYLVDTHTAVTFDTSLASIDDGFQLMIITIVPSPDNTYFMQLDSTNRSYSISVFDMDRNLVAQRLEDSNYTYAGGIWVDDTHVLMRRTDIQFIDNIDFLLLDVTTNQAHVIATTETRQYYQSPHNNWLFITPQASDDNALVNIWDSRQIALNDVIAFNFDWSVGENYFASNASISGDSMMQIVNTQTGDISLDDFAPLLLRWSPVSNDLLAVTANVVRLYNESNFVIEVSTPDYVIFDIVWSDTGEKALLRLQSANQEIAVMVIDMASNPPLTQIVDLLPNTGISSPRFTADERGIIFVTFPDATPSSEIYYLNLTNYQINHVITLNNVITTNVQYYTDISHLND